MAEEATEKVIAEDEDGYKIVQVGTVEISGRTDKLIKV